MVCSGQALCAHLWCNEGRSGSTACTDRGHGRMLGYLGPVETGENGEVVVADQDSLGAEAPVYEGLAARSLGVEIDECLEGVKGEVQPRRRAPRCVRHAFC